VYYSLIMKVLRVQNENGNGPYIDSPQELQTQLNHVAASSKLPVPDEDCGIDRMPKQNEHCGFSNQEQLEYWFDDDELELLESYGYYIVELDAEITAVGECQVLFTIN